MIAASGVVGELLRRARRRRRRLVSSQPSVATRPLRASMPRASRPGNLRHMSRNQSGRLSAEVPSTSRDRPSSRSDSIVASSRMPPPSSHSMSTAARMARTAARLTGLPARAPSRSTRCRCWAPSRCELAGDAGGVVGEDGLAGVVALLRAARTCRPTGRWPAKSASRNHRRARAAAGDGKRRA